MSNATAYQPGVCNIGPAEIRRRRASGYLGLALTIVFLALAFALDWAAPWRLLVFLPAAMAASGFLQAAFHFCARFGSVGLYNFGDIGSEDNVLEAEFRAQDQRKARQIILLSVAIGAVVAIAAFVIPV